MQTQNFWQRTSQGITVYINGKGSSIASSSPQFNDLVAACRAKDWAKAKSLMTMKSLFNENGARIKVSSDHQSLLYIGTDNVEHVIGGTLVDRVFKAFSQGLSVKAIRPLMLFLDNVMHNKHESIRNELYEFMQAGTMPITEDGCFLALKKVRNDYMDIYTGTMSNAPGKVVTMKPNEIGDTNRNNTCSHGLHFAAASYLPKYSSRNSNDRVVVVKVNPRHVFAIPVDYGYAKGRASEYYVIGEVTGADYSDETFVKSIVFNEDIVKGNDATKKVVFVSELKASIKTIANGYGLANGDEVYVRVCDSKGNLTPDKYSVVRDIDGKWISAITGKEVPYDHLQTMSITTKSVRNAVVKAISKLRKDNHT